MDMVGVNNVRLHPGGNLLQLTHTLRQTYTWVERVTFAGCTT